MSKVSTARLAIVYTLWLIGGLVLMALLMIGAEMALQMEIRNPAMGFIMVYVAAATVGTYMFKREGAPSKGRIWRVALACALVTVGLQALIAVGLFQVGGYSVAQLGVRQSDIGVLVGVLGFFAIIELLVIRLALGLSIRANVKQAAVKAAKTFG